ncbi:Sigma-70 family RNA polymerase sigma factor [Nocardioides dubius]|uniref:RNA polymerase sigma factor 70 region 4 type 2 domain-containing protein n=1 Tax=Nocardioides dubius TaxID=317019 RepID=A0ABN1U0A3_9ACTN
MVSETFLHAWRRWNELPDPPIGWLLGTARKVIANRVRGAVRNRALVDRVALLDAVAADVADHRGLAGPDAALARREALERLAALPGDQREALLLVAWDGLTTEQAAAALGVRSATFRKRLSRARAALSSVEDPPPEPGLPPLAARHPIKETS